MHFIKSDCEKFQQDLIGHGVSRESEHVQKCQSCQEFISFYHDLRLGIRGSVEVEVNPFLTTRIQALAYESVMEAPKAKWSWVLGFMPKMAPAFVALTMFVSFGYVLGTKQSGLELPPVSRLSSFQGATEFPGIQKVAFGEVSKPSFVSENSGISFERQLEEYRKLTMESDADGLLMKGRRLKAMGKVDQALKEFENILELYPNYTYMGDVLMYRSQCYAILGRFDEAVDSLETYLEKNPAKRSLIEPMINQIQETSQENTIAY